MIQQLLIEIRELQRLTEEQSQAIEDLQDEVELLKGNKTKEKSKKKLKRITMQAPVPKWEKEGKSKKEFMQDKKVRSQ